MKGKIKTTLLIAIFILAMIPALPIAAPATLTIEVSGLEETLTVGPKTINVLSEHIVDVGAPLTEEHFLAEPETLVLYDEGSIDAQSQITTIDGSISDLYLSIDGVGAWPDTAYVNIGMRPETDKDRANAGVWMVLAATSHGGGPPYTYYKAQLQDYTGQPTEDDIYIMIPRGLDDYRYKITLIPEGDIGGTAYLEFWADGEHYGPLSHFYGYEGSWEELVPGEHNEDYSEAYLFYSIKADRRGTASITYDATVEASIELPNGVKVGDDLTISGTGVTAGETVKVGWDGLKAWDGEKGILNTTEANPDGTYDCTLEVLEAPVGDHYIWAQDTNTLATSRSDPILVVPKIKLSPSSGLQDDKVTITGYGYAAESDLIDVTFAGASLETLSPRTPTTDELGSWTATFKVPQPDGPYDVVAMDENGYTALAKFTVGAGISLDIDEGPTGTVVEIDGRGFEPYVTLDTGDFIVYGDITIDGVDCYILDLPTGGIKVDKDGEFSCEIVIPQVSKVRDYTITVDPKADETGNIADADFEVLGLAEIEVTPSFGVQGSSVDIEGWNFTQINDEEVSIELWVGEDHADYPDKVVDIETVEVNSNGYFKERIRIPARASDPYEIRAIQTTYNIYAKDGFRIGMMIAIASPESGPTGTKVTLSGAGFTKSGTWNATFGDWTITDGDDVDEEGNLDMGGVPTFYVPTVDPGTYTIIVLDIDADIEVELDFTVTKKTMLMLDPLVAPQDYNITISGKYFAADGDDEHEVDLDFVLYNDTEEWDMEVYQMWDHDDDGGVVTANKERLAEVNDEGNFTAYWNFNEEDLELDIGKYTINCTDDEDLTAEIFFSVVAKTSEIDARKYTFRIGDTVGFNVESSFAQDNSYIKIWDPDGELYWTTDDFITDSWQKVGTIQIVPFYKQTAGENPMVLLDDAPLGTWTWKWYDADDDKIDSGVFNVEAAAADVLGEQVEDINQAIEDLTDDIIGVSDSVAGLQTNINSAVQAANAAVDASNAAIEAVNAGVAQSADAAAAAERAAEAAGKAQEAAGGLTTLVYGAIGASLVAALAAIVSLMQISKRIAG